MMSNKEEFLSDELLEALMQEEWLEPMGKLKQEYQDIPVPNQAQYAVLQGIQRAKNEGTAETAVYPSKRKYGGRFYGAMTVFATAAAVCMLFVGVNANAQLATAVADIPALKPVVEFMTGQEYHEDVYLNVKVEHLAGQKGNGSQAAMPVQLGALFVEEADYITILSDEIKRQIQQSEAYDTLDTFTAITPEQRYYINAEGDLVIVLDAYASAPEFVIKAECIEDILK